MKFRVMDLVSRANQPRDIVLCVGQPPTGAPRTALGAACEAMGSLPLGYTAIEGIPQLRQRIAEDYPGSTADDVVVTTGASGGLTALFMALKALKAREVRNNDVVGEASAGGQVAVAMARPGYPAYRNLLRSIGCGVVEMPCGMDTRFQPTAPMVEGMLAEHPEVAAVIVTSPANPTGTIIESDELEAIVRVCQQRGVILISDEIYHGLEYTDHTCTSAWGMRGDAVEHNVVVVGSFSKFYSMTGWRVGWLLLPPSLRDMVVDIQGNLALCAPAVSQYAALGAFDSEEPQAHVAHYARNRELLSTALEGALPHAPIEGAFYAWVDVSSLTDDSEAWCNELLDRFRIAIAPGIDFDEVDGHRYVRISFCCDTKELGAAMDILAANYLKSTSIKPRLFNTEEHS